MTYPNNTQAGYTYDNLNRLVDLVNGLSASYHSGSSGSDHSKPFDDCHSERSEESRYSSTNTKPISSYDYEYNLAGMRIKVTLKDGTYIEYEYDVLNRLTKETKYKPHQWDKQKHLIYSYEYTFDAVGNRLTMRRNLHQPMFWGCYNSDDLMDDIKHDLCRNGFERDTEGDDDEVECKCFRKEPPFKPSILTRYTYNEENQLFLEEEGIEWKNKFISLKKTEYVYDNNGNQIIKTISRGCKRWQKEWVTAYEYDYENRLIKITYPEQGEGNHQGWGEGKGWGAKVATTEYRYDGVGKRIKSIENGDITKYLYDGLSVIIERDENDKTTAFYVRGISYGGGIGGIISAAHPKRGPHIGIKTWRNIANGEIMHS
jgi:hypothetical protein